MTGYFKISKKNLKCIGSKGNRPSKEDWHNSKVFYIPCRLWMIWKRHMNNEIQDERDLKFPSPHSESKP